MKLLVYTNEEGVKRGINPIDSGSSLHTQPRCPSALSADEEAGATSRPNCMMPAP